MQVIDAYVNLMKAQDGLKKRQGGTVYLETACLTACMKCVTGWYGDAAKFICGFTSTRKKWISEISSCRY